MRQEHTLRLQDEFSQLLHRNDRIGITTQTPSSGRHDGALSTAWSARQLQPLFRPVVDLGSGMLRGLRCDLAGSTLPADLPPLALLDWAERNGVSAEVTQHLIATVCAQSRQWPLRRGDAFTLSVPVTPQAVSSPGWAEAVLEQLARHRLPGRRLCLELREDRLVGASIAVIESLSRLRDAGVRVGLTGFGTGRSTLTALRRLPVDSILIDATLVRDIAHDPVACEIVRTVVQLASTLNLEVVAMGVDRAAVVPALTSLQCAVAEGDYFLALPDSEAVAQILAQPMPLWPPAVS